MYLGLIDVVEWQSTVDMRTGRPVEMSHPLLDMASEICAGHPYPGDLTMKGAGWVTDTALALNQAYAPQFMFLNYADLFFDAAFCPPAGGDPGKKLDVVFSEVDRFIQQSGFTPVVVGLGDMMPLLGYVNTINVEGLGSVAGMSSRFGGIFNPTVKDLFALTQREDIERIITRESFRELFGGSEEFYRVCPDVLMLTKPGYVFRGVNVGCRTLYQVAKPQAELPVHSELTGWKNITDLAGVILKELEHRKIALILVEAVGVETFPWSFKPVSNQLHWYRYTMDINQYLALTSGLHFIEYPHPPGYRFELYDEPTAPYPFSGTFRKIPDRTIGRRFAGKSAAVGSRSFLTHLSSGADITIECFARSLYNHGVFAVVDV